MKRRSWAPISSKTLLELRKFYSNQKDPHYTMVWKQETTDGGGRWSWVEEGKGLGLGL